MTPTFSLQQPHIRAKIIGILLITLGSIFFLNYFFSNDQLSLKIGFTSLLIGVFTIAMITEKSIPQRISETQIQGNLHAVTTITQALNLTGNAIFLPTSEILTKERVFIPLNNTQRKISESLDDDFVFSTGQGGESLGIALQPSGYSMLQELEKEGDFANTDLDAIEEKLQTFIGMNLLKSISFTQREKDWHLTVEKPLLCPNNILLCRQYPCPTCSAALIALTRSSKQKIRINDVIIEGKKTAFHLRPED